MDSFTKMIAETMTPSVIIIAGVWIIRRDLNTLAKDVRDIKKKCEERLIWCINHFKDK